jgi:hypothetical protein
VTPESSFFLQKARKLLGEADVMLTTGLNDAAGRTACLAGLHAAGIHLRANRQGSEDA